MYQFPSRVTLQAVGNSWLGTLPLRSNRSQRLHNICHRFTVCRDSINPLVRKLYISPQLPTVGIVYVPASELRINFEFREGKIVGFLQMPMRYKHLTSPIQQLVAFSVEFLEKGQLSIEFVGVHHLKPGEEIKLD